MTQGFVEIIWSKPELITNPVLIPHRTSKWNGKLMSVGDTGQTTMAIRCRRWGGPKSGNVKNANWRKIHGGGFCSPLNLKFKGGK